MMYTSVLFILAATLESVTSVKKNDTSRRTIKVRDRLERLEPLEVNNTACEFFAKDVDFEPEKAVGHWNLVYVSSTINERCRRLELSHVGFMDAVGWMNSVRGLLVDVKPRLAAVKYKLWNLFGAGSVLLQLTYSPGAMVFVPSAAALRAQPMPSGMTLQLQFKQTQQYEFLSFMLCDSESVYVLARGRPPPAAVRRAARELGAPEHGRVLCELKRTPAAEQRRTLPLRQLPRH